MIINHGVQLRRKPDTLLWMGGDTSGRISVKNIYEAIENKKQYLVIGGWRKSLWSWEVPMKLKLFTWLMIENKILTWEILQRRGFVGPGWCMLCKKNLETNFHLFVECPFTRSVWERIKLKLNFPGTWTGNSMNERFKNWRLLFTDYLTLPLHICWNIWKERTWPFSKMGFHLLRKL
jgi:hypothetical protein